MARDLAGEGVAEVAEGAAAVGAAELMEEVSKEMKEEKE